MEVASTDRDARARQTERRVLVCVTGLTPQVVTETLYALMREGSAALPHEVHILTTSVGAERVRSALLVESAGWFHRFLADYGLEPIAFTDAHVHVLRDRNDEWLSDIRNAGDNMCAADQVAELVRGLTVEANDQLHVSLAGGRKTLAFFAGYALSLWGRRQDRLTHVLVDDPYESSPDFFYPTPYERIITTRQGRLADCRHARVTLADLPFVRLRHGLPSTVLSGESTFAQAVQAAQVRLGPNRLTVDLGAQHIVAGGHVVTLAPAELAFLAWFARRAQLDLPPIPCPSDGVPSKAYAEAYLSEYRRLRGVMADDGRTAARYRDGMGKGDFEERKSKLKRALLAALGQAAWPYLVSGEGRRPMRFKLRLSGDRIVLKD